MKLDPLQRNKIQEAHRHASGVLQEVKQKRLRGQDLEDMKTLETAVQNLELFLLP